MITRIELARRLGYTCNGLSDWLKGEREISLSISIKIKEMLGVDMPLEELFAKSPVQQTDWTSHRL